MGLLETIRKTVPKYISDNPVSIIVDKYTLKDNGYGIKIPDLSVQPTIDTLGTARIMRRRLPDPIVTDARSPYDYLDAYYMIATYDSSWLRRGLIFNYYNRRFRTLLVEDRVINGGIAYKLCDLEEVTPDDGGTMYE